VRAAVLIIPTVVLSDYGRRRLCMSAYFRVRAPMAASADKNSYSRRASTSYTTISVRWRRPWTTRQSCASACMCLLSWCVCASLPVAYMSWVVLCMHAGHSHKPRLVASVRMHDGFTSYMHHHPRHGWLALNVMDLRSGRAWVFTYPDCCYFPRVVVSSVVEDVLNFNGTPAAKGELAYYAGHARLHDLAHIPWYWIRQRMWKKARKEAKQKCVVKI
jgi:hypothetical protein